MPSENSPEGRKEPAVKNKAALAARLKARLSARRTPAQSRFTMPAGTPASLQQQMKDFKSGKTSQLPTPPKTSRPPLQLQGVVGNGTYVEQKKAYLNKKDSRKVLKNDSANARQAAGKGGSGNSSMPKYGWSGTNQKFGTGK